MPRPEKHPDERRTRRHNLRFTTAEHHHIRRQADAAGLDTAEYLRRRALGYVVPAGTGPRRADPALITEVNRLALQLKGLGVLANQLALSTHTGRRFRGDWEALAVEIGASRQQVTAVLERLLAAEE
jgi:hypothetical protein